MKLTSWLTTVTVLLIISLVIYGFYEVMRVKNVYVESETMSEQASVIAPIYTPSKHESNLTYNLTGGGMGGVGIGIDGNIGIGIGSGLMITSSTIPEKYAIVFQCKHGEFIVEGREIYQQLSLMTGKEVTVYYKEIYREEYDRYADTLISRTLEKYDFLYCE